MDDLGFMPDQKQEDDLGFVPESSPYRDTAMAALGTVKDTFTAPWDLAQGLAKNPQALQEKAGPWLPTVGAGIGTAFMPGLGTAIGGGVGEMARQMGDIAFNTKDAIPAGSNFSAKAGIDAAAQTALAGANVVNKIGGAAMPFAESKALALAKQTGAAEPAPFVDRTVRYLGDKLAPVGEAVKKGVARAAEVMTGAPARSGVKLIEEPQRLVAGIGTTGKLGKAVEDAESVSAARVSPKLRAKITTNEEGIATKTVSDLLEKKYTPGSVITPEEAAAGIKAIDATFPAYTAKNNDIIREYSDLRTQLSEMLAEVDPKLAAAKGAYSDAMVGGAFRHPFRQTKTGQTSAVPFLAALLSPKNWNPSELGKQALKLPAFSPVVWGTGMAAGSAAAKVAGAAISSPAARQALISRYIGSRSDKGKQ